MKYTEEELKKWKAKYGELFEISVDDKSCVLHRPTRQDLSFASVVKDPIKMSETMLNTLWVSGDDEIKSDDTLFLAAIQKMQDVLEVKEATIKKL